MLRNENCSRNVLASKRCNQMANDQVHEGSPQDKTPVAVLVCVCVCGVCCTAQITKHFSGSRWKGSLRQDEQMASFASAFLKPSKHGVCGVPCEWSLPCVGCTWRTEGAPGVSLSQSLRAAPSGGRGGRGGAGSRSGGSVGRRLEHVPARAGGAPVSLPARLRLAF